MRGGQLFHGVDEFLSMYSCIGGMVINEMKGLRVSKKGSSSQIEFMLRWYSDVLKEILMLHCTVFVQSDC